MNRRTFARTVALGLSGAALGEVRAQPPQGEASTPAQPGGSAPQQRPVTVSEFRALAESKLPRPIFEYVESGSMDQVTLRENIAAFQRIKLLPPVLRGVATTDLTTTVLGQPIKFPVMLAPVAGQRLYHPQGALAAARAATAAGTIQGVSSSATNSIEEIAAASDGAKWYQLYVPKDRAIAKRLVQRAERAGYRAIIVTVDLGEWKDSDRRNRFALPREMLVKHLGDLGFAGNFDAMSHEEIITFNSSAWDLAFSWELFDWLRGVTKLPLLIKGVLRREDAEKAVAIGLDGIIVSNHGGRRLDGMPASIEMLPQVVEALKGRAEVYLDSGVRRGTDVLKALALGARAVLIGRPYVWGLAADGEAGVSHVLKLLRDELENVLLSAGCPSVREVPRSLVMP